MPATATAITVIDSNSAKQRVEERGRWQGKIELHRTPARTNWEKESTPNLAGVAIKSSQRGVWHEKDEGGAGELPVSA